ncbi:hypothetical protein [Ramlibacter pallidus]|uniref:Uncharacterized protein n=1 Tax=Ramlibacter pallidus TaxID=2780087 RepID=A0ABR9S2F1_9BURK|nr:hypothetical protein [Ramlibacter pallidus]MBE7367678.1 hypothetical protein [Ramlibacter pallidus]
MLALFLFSLTLLGFFAVLGVRMAMSSTVPEQLREPEMHGTGSQAAADVVNKLRGGAVADIKAELDKIDEVMRLMKDLERSGQTVEGKPLVLHSPQFAGGGELFERTPWMRMLWGRSGDELAELRSLEEKAKGTLAAASEANFFLAGRAESVADGLKDLSAKIKEIEAKLASVEKERKV